MAETNTAGCRGIAPGILRTLWCFLTQDPEGDEETAKLDFALLSDDAFFSSDASNNPEMWKAFFRLKTPGRLPVPDYLRLYSYMSKTFSVDNPLHDFLEIESEIGDATLIRDAYLITGEILAKLKRSLPLLSSPVTAAKTQSYLKAVYDEIRAAGIKVGSKEGVPFFHRGIADKVLDCDTSTMVVLAVAHEMGWPVYPVMVPQHVFARWDDGAGTRFNIDHGYIYEDEYYMTWPQAITKESVDSGVYLKNLTREEMKAILFYVRASAKSEMGRYQEAVADCDRAIELYPKSVGAYHARAIAKAEMGRHEEAFADYDKAIELDPKYANAYYGRAIAKGKLGRLEEAVANYDKAIELDPNDHSAYAGRACARSALKQHNEAIADFSKAFELDPSQKTYFFHTWIERAVGEYPPLASIVGHDMTVDRTNLIFNWARGDMIGQQVVGFCNASGNAMAGRQGAFGNIATRNMTGVQLAVFANYLLHGTMSGMQIGLLNAVMDGDMKGLQIGAINYAAGEMESTWGILNLSARCNYYIADPFGGDTCVFGRKDGK